MADVRGYRQRVGRSGEEDAVKYLERKGYRILVRNFRTEDGEVDAVAEHEGVLVFVEVKTNVRGGFGEPEDRVDPKKQARMGRVAMGYLQAKGLEDVDCRFDVVTVTRTRGRTAIRHIEDAFWLDANQTERGF